MIKSMTGYGRHRAGQNGKHITVEIKSVNHRYFDCAIKYPRAFGFLEDPIKQCISKTIHRGKVDCYVSIDSTESGETSIRLNKPLLEQYIAAAWQMAEVYGVEDDLATTSLLKIPDIFLEEKKEVDSDEWTAEVLSVLVPALETMDAMRCAEGETLGADLTKRLGLIEELMDNIEARSPQSVREYHEKLLARMQEALEGTSVDPQRIVTEAALFADRVAVDEETVRLRSHLSQLQSMLQETTPVGRKLDFLVQELNREANTIGSKGNDLEMTQLVVELKSQIEKIREQVQNIE